MNQPFIGGLYISFFIVRRAFVSFWDEQTSSLEVYLLFLYLLRVNVRTEDYVIFLKREEEESIHLYHFF